MEFNVFDSLSTTPEEQLLEAIRDRRYPRAYALLRKLEAPLSGQLAASCLVETMKCSKKLFRAVLDACTGDILFGSIRAESEGYFFQLSGTLLVLAAAVGMPEHVSLLLEWGYDVNAASAESACGDEGPDHWAIGPEYRRCAAPGNELQVFPKNKDGQYVVIRGCTPLAAAIAFANPFTMETLCESPGVWKAESSAVCRAAALHGEGMSLDPAWVLPWSPSGQCFSANLKGRLLPQENMQPGSFADFCSPALLKAQFSSGACTEADGRAVLAALDRNLFLGRFSVHKLGIDERSPDSFPPLLEKFRLTAERFPGLFQGAAELGQLLRACVCAVSWGLPMPEDLLRRWKELSGKTRDISAAARDISRLPTDRVRLLLEKLAEGGRLEASADAYRPSSMAELRVFLQYVRFIPSPIRTGISALAMGVLALPWGNRELQVFLRKGLLACEPKEALIRLADTPIRPLLLILEEREPEKLYDPGRITFGFSHYLPEDDGEKTWFRDVLCGTLSEEDCLARLICSRSIQGICAQPVPDIPPVSVCGSLQEQICFAPNPNALKAWCRLHPGFLSQGFSTGLKGPLAGTLTGGPLAQAAAAGRTEAVRYCLEQGIEPDQLCMLNLDEFPGPVACTPFLLALLFGREETARLLLEAGAALDLSREPWSALLRAAGPEARALADRLRDLV